MTYFIDTLVYNNFYSTNTPTINQLGTSISIKYTDYPYDVITIYWIPHLQNTIMMLNLEYYTMPNTAFNLSDIFRTLGISFERLNILNIRNKNYYNLLDTHIKDIDYDYRFKVYSDNETVPPIPDTIHSQ
jgi:hypothetical protein